MRQALVVDDHPVVRDAIKRLLEKSLPSLEVTTSPGDQDVLDEICGAPWAFVVLDINLGTTNGLDIIKKAKVRQPDTAIIVFSLYSESQYADRAIRAGATAYFSKERSPLELVKLAKDILEGRRIHKPIATRPVLSDREIQVLTLLARGMTRTQIAVELAISTKTVSTYQSRLLQKLSVRNVIELIRYAVEEGLVG